MKKTWEKPESIPSSGTVKGLGLGGSGFWVQVPDLKAFRLVALFLSLSDMWQPCCMEEAHGKLEMLHKPDEGKAVQPPMLGGSDLKGRERFLQQFDKYHVGFKVLLPQRDFNT